MRIAGINIPDDKRIEAALTYIYGVGPAISKKILAETGINPDVRAKELNSSDISKIKDVLDSKYKTEGELRTEIKQNIARLKDIQSYKGARHSRKLPVRGQRTKTNSRTVRGNIRKTATSGKRKVELK
ncbi:MAG: 30S ribosomal protein S13 [Candidatus Colwellbacteria bacterium]|jgi:small subunit ribosomal protein S13|nr:30S ribosomal protein S13 [Candidatus Colwellbacteria bacterium]MCK9497595.1 30S ribosomal protein S13 [Candidatus Colwellbacteria bacterium]MDD3752405.1 30S ribosomal protein S13 [Candidatus Colwellbacteria bacterium]MDD4818812.1 30S ribosomal protein S13 [Candidatus Colwellbacteria bacterium]